MKLRHRKVGIGKLIMGTCESMVAKDEVLPPRQVRTNYGIVEGRSYKTKNGGHSDCFMGIPYAKPPVGELRFRKPEPPEPWEDVKKCRKFGNRAVQSDMFWDKATCFIPQSEDCLYLNIFAPALDPTKKYPVMFYIHGGGFMMDSSVRYTPENVSRLIVSRGIVVVTIQYRLGYLGYMCTGDDAAKGNYGLWDQYEALKWTKENIHHFGGDPNQITVSGQSAGAVSADLLSISPLSRDMFNRKIVMGGNSFCHWAVAKTDEISEFCRKKALKVGWKPRKEGYSSNREENHDMIEFLRTVPASKLGTHMIGCSPVFKEARLPLAPVVDGEILPKRPSELRLDAPSMESIVGVGEQESLLFVALGLIRCNGKDIDRVINVVAKKTKKLSHKEVEEAVKKVYGDTDLSRKHKKATQEMCVTMLSDVISNYACFRFMQHSQSHDRATYAYSFDYQSNRMWGWLPPVVPFLAGTHTSELIYLFDCNYMSSPWPMNQTDRAVSENTASWFTEFIKKGNPNRDDQTDEKLSWDPVPKEGNVTMISISDEPKMKQEVFGNRMHRLNEILLDSNMYSYRDLIER